MPHDFLGIGWSFPVAARDGAAALSVDPAHYEESVRQSIWIILSTARGERVMRPDFGCGIHNLVFALDNASTAGLVQHEVEQALLFWEPRINVLRVDVSSEQRGGNDPHSLRLEYRRFRELEARRRFRALPYSARAALLRDALSGGVAVAGPVAPTLPAGDIDERILKAIKVPEFDEWHAERRVHLSGPALFISIEYAVKATNSRYNVVYPFYLERRPI